MHDSTPSLRPTQSKSVEKVTLFYSKRYLILVRLLPSAADRERYHQLTERLTPERMSFESNADMAERLGCSVSTIQNLKRKLQKAGLAEVTLRPTGKASNLTNASYFPVIDKSFLAARGIVRVGTKSCRVKQDLDLKNKSNTPLPPKGGGVVVHPEPERIASPTPTPEVHEALRQAREFRAQRKAERRATRRPRVSYRAARKQIREAHGGSFDERAAVAYVMQVLGVSTALWRSRMAIQTSVQRWVGTIHEPERYHRAAIALAGHWKEYLERRPLLHYPCSLLTFFGECRWAEDIPMHEKRSIRARLKASEGTYQQVERFTRDKFERVKALSMQLAGEEWEESDEDNAGRADSVPLLSGPVGRDEQREE
jgi:hypothetical protein